jgi:hypothetical protein
MCARLQIGQQEVKPGHIVRVVTSTGSASLPWAGFARSEILHWWTRNGAVPCTVTAERFAERDDDTGTLTWEDIPDGLAVRGLVDARGPSALLKVVTRAATPDEFARYRHPRVPVLIPAPPPEPSAP